MLITFEEASKLINDGKLLHIAGAGNLLKKLPKGNWIGGSTECFMTEEGGVFTDGLLLATELTCDSFSLKSYGANEIGNVAADAYSNGFSIMIMPFESAVYEAYAKNTAGCDGVSVKNIVGWASGLNLGIIGQTPVTAIGAPKAVYPDRAVALHLEISA